jgi:hypothetical protein
MLSFNIKSIILNGVMLSVIVLNVVAPQCCPKRKASLTTVALKFAHVNESIVGSTLNVLVEFSFCKKIEIASKSLFSLTLVSKDPGQYLQKFLR